MKMASIFISHAVVDAKLAELLVDFLKEAIGVPSDEIFCSSLPDHAIPFGEDFNAYIRSKIEAPKLVLLLMTPAYLDSAFCMMELGAAWSRGHNALPIVVPPVKFDMITKTLGLKQAWDITKKDGLIELRKMVTPLVTLEKRGEHAWDKKRVAWKADVSRISKSLAPAQKVDVATHKAVQDKLDELEEDARDLEAQLDEQKELVAALEQAKDRAEVKAIKAAHSGDDGLQEQFEDLLGEVKIERPDDLSGVVFRYMLMAYYDKQGTIDWYSHDAEFTAAVQRNLLSDDGSYAVNWSSKKLRGLRKAIAALDTFLTGPDGKVLTDSWEDHIPHEPDDIDFWRHHLHI
jgi:hypothetical protein